MFQPNKFEIWIKIDVKQHRDYFYTQCTQIQAQSYQQDPNESYKQDNRC
jgi:hypothetical protein